MRTTVYFVKGGRFVGVGHGMVAWSLVNASSMIEVMKAALKDALDYHKQLDRERWMLCDRAWVQQMSRWFTTKEDLQSFDYAIVMDYKIPGSWFKELEAGSLTVEVIANRREAGQLEEMPVKVFDGLLATFEAHDAE